MYNVKTHVKCPFCKYRFKTGKPLVTQCSKIGGGCGKSFPVKKNED